MSDRPILRPAADWRETLLARVHGPVEGFMHAPAAGDLVLLGPAGHAFLRAADRPG